MAPPADRVLNPLGISRALSHLREFVSMKVISCRGGFFYFQRRLSTSMAKFKSWIIFGMLAALSVALSFGVYRFIDSRAGFTSAIYPPTEREELFAMLARDFNLPQLCAKIRPNAGSVAPLAAATASSLRSQCYYAVAVGTKNPTLCGQVKPLSTLLYSHAESEARCRTDIQKGVRGISVPFPSDEFLKTFMNKLGYKDQDIVMGLYPGNTLGKVYPTDYFSYYGEHILWGDSQDDQKIRREFVQKVINEVAAE